MFYIQYFAGLNLDAKYKPSGIYIAKSAERERIPALSVAANVNSGKMAMLGSTRERLTNSMATETNHTEILRPV